MIRTVSLVIHFILSACLLAACTGGQGGITPGATQPVSEEAKLQHGAANAILEAVTAKVTRDAVRKQYGELSVENFAKYFGSPEYAEELTKKFGKAPKISYTTDAYATTNVYEPNSLVLYPSGDKNDQQLTVASVDEKGNLKGGYGVKVNPNAP